MKYNNALHYVIYCLMIFSVEDSTAQKTLIPSRLPPAENEGKERFTCGN